jgi:hypothetical protein
MSIKKFKYKDYSDACAKIGAEQSRKYANKDLMDNRLKKLEDRLKKLEDQSDE